VEDEEITSDKKTSATCKRRAHFGEPTANANKHNKQAPQGRPCREFHSIGSERMQIKGGASSL
jgi:hypothetical protein